MVFEAQLGGILGGLSLYLRYPKDSKTSWYIVTKHPQNTCALLRCEPRGWREEGLVLQYLKWDWHKIKTLTLVSCIHSKV